MKFTTTLVQICNNTGIEVPPEVRDALGGGKTPLVQVTLNGFGYKSKIAAMGGRLLVSVSAEVRQKAGVKGGETHEVELVLDTAPRVYEAPADLRHEPCLDRGKIAVVGLVPGHVEVQVGVMHHVEAP